MRDILDKPLRSKILKQIKQKCAECHCVIDNLFTGMYIMAKGHGRKIVCGVCAAQLEVKGWKEIGRAK